MYTKHYNVRKTLQSTAIPGRSDMVKNNAGGFGFSVDDWERLNRFLIMGSCGGTFYVEEKKLTLDNADAVLRCIAEDGGRVIATATRVSVDGRAPKNEPAIFVLALCVKFGDAATKRCALVYMKDVCRIGTHLFTFAQYLKDLNVGWGRGVRNAFASWYNTKTPSSAAYQVLKYQGRVVIEKDNSSRWTHADILRLAHPTPSTQAHSDVFKWAIKGWKDDDDIGSVDLAQIYAYEAIKTASTEDHVLGLIQDYNLTREMVPTKWLNSVRVWEVLLARMPLNAMVRNLGKMTSMGLVKTFSNAAMQVGKRLHDQEYIKKSRLHPLGVLVAMMTYAQGYGNRGDLSWDPVGSVVDSLNDAFYLAFGNVVPTGKRTMLCLDLSGSMQHPIAGMPISARAGSAAMALVTKAVEPNCMVCGFTMQGKDAISFSGQSAEGLALGVSELPISQRQRLDDVVRSIENTWGCGGNGWNSTYRFTGTDCSLPMRYATKRKIPVDAFVVYTDSETWAGNMHPTQALDEFRQVMGIDAKLVVVGMVSNSHTVADPTDPKQLDVVGFDTSTPNAISEFIRG